MAEDRVLEATENTPDAPCAVALQWYNQFMGRRDERCQTASASRRRGVGASARSNRQLTRS
jgi:hypothetical protein